MSRVLSSISRTTTKKLQTFVFSATLTYAHPTSKKQGVIHPENMAAEDKISELLIKYANFFHKFLNICSSCAELNFDG